MKSKKITMLVVLSCLLVLLFANMILPFSAYAQKQNEITGTKGVSIIGCKLKGSCVSPCQMIIAKGSTITWTNMDNDIHMITGGSAQNGPDGQFSSSIIAQHGTFSHKFERTGAFVYYDNLHPKMEGVIIVYSTTNLSYIHLAQSQFSNWCSR